MVFIRVRRTSFGRISFVQIILVKNRVGDNIFFGGPVARDRARGSAGYKKEIQSAARNQLGSCRWGNGESRAKESEEARRW